MLKSKKWGERILVLMLVLFAVGCIFFSNTDSKALGMKNEYITPNQYSNILSAILLVAVGGEIVMSLRGKKTEEEAAAPPKGELKAELRSVGFMVLCSVIYVLGMRHVGFYITSAVCLFVMNMAFEGWKKSHLWKSAVFSLGVCLITFVVFKYLKVYLPKSMFF